MSDYEETPAAAAPHHHHHEEDDQQHHLASQPRKESASDESSRVTQSEHSSEARDELDHLRDEVAREEKALAALQGDDFDEQLQLHSEVARLRKELELAKNSEATLKERMEDGKGLMDCYDPSVEADVDRLEHEAERCPIQELWHRVKQSHENDSVQLDGSDVMSMGARLQEAKSRFDAANARAVELHNTQQESINKNTDARERTKATLLASFKEEMGSLEKSQECLRQVADEKRFHAHRGTTRRPPVSTQKSKDIRSQRTVTEEIRANSQRHAMSTELQDLVESVKEQKKLLDGMRAVSEKRQAELAHQLEEVVEEGREASELKEKLQQENDYLNALRTDVQGVLQYVKAKKREEYYC